MRCSSNQMCSWVAKRLSWAPSFADLGLCLQLFGALPATADSNDVHHLVAAVVVFLLLQSTMCSPSLCRMCLSCLHLRLLQHFQTSRSGSVEIHPLCVISREWFGLLWNYLLWVPLWPEACRQWHHLLFFLWRWVSQPVQVVVTSKVMLGRWWPLLPRQVCFGSFKLQDIFWIPFSLRGETSPHFWKTFRICLSTWIDLLHNV